jgi:hypothetical protein
MPIQPRYEADNLIVDGVDLKRTARNILREFSAPGAKLPSDLSAVMEILAKGFGKTNLHALQQAARAGVESVAGQDSVTPARRPAFGRVSIEGDAGLAQDTLQKTEPAQGDVAEDILDERSTVDFSKPSRDNSTTVLMHAREAFKELRPTHDIGIIMGQTGWRRESAEAITINLPRVLRWRAENGQVESDFHAFAENAEERAVAFVHVICEPDVDADTMALLVNGFARRHFRTIFSIEHRKHLQFLVTAARSVETLELMQVVDNDMDASSTLPLRSAADGYSADSVARHAAIAAYSETEHQVGDSPDFVMGHLDRVRSTGIMNLPPLSA